MGALTHSGEDVAVYARRTITRRRFNAPMLVTGVLELGTLEGPEPGVVNRVRRMDARFRRA